MARRNHRAVGADAPNPVDGACLVEGATPICVGELPVLHDEHRFGDRGDVAKIGDTGLPLPRMTTSVGMARIRVVTGATRMVVRCSRIESRVSTTTVLCLSPGTSAYQISPRLTINPRPRPTPTRPRRRGPGLR